MVQNRNDLIAAYPWVDGVKTGYTLNAGNVLVGAAARGPRARVISVVLGEPSEAARDSETLTLLRWGLAQFRRVRMVDTKRALARADVQYYDEKARLVPRRDVSLTIRDGERLRRRVSAPDELEGPLDAGDSRRFRYRGGGRQAGAARCARHRGGRARGGDAARGRIGAGRPADRAHSPGILVAVILAILRVRIRIRIAR